MAEHRMRTEEHRAKLLGLDAAHYVHLYLDALSDEQLAEIAYGKAEAKRKPQPAS